MKKLLPYFFIITIFMACDTQPEQQGEADEAIDQETELDNTRNLTTNVEGIEIVQVKPIDYLGMEADVQKNNMAFLGNTITELYGKILEQVTAENAPDTLKPLSVYQSFGADQLEMIIAMQLPNNVDQERVQNEVNQFGSTDGGYAVKSIHRGSYANLLDTHKKIKNYIQQENLKMMGYPFEIYTASPIEEADTANWITEIYYPIDGGQFENME